MQRNHSIDILRCVFAFMVVYLHTHYWVGYPMDVCRCAVPGFMAMTGFFVYSVNKDKIQERLLKSCKHHVKIYAWALLLYISLTILYCHKNADFSCFTVNNLIKSLFYAETDFLYFGFHLWYLHAVIYALLILYLFSKHNLIKILVWISPLLLIANIEFFKSAVEQYIGTYHLPTYISYGIPYLIIGLGIKKHEEKIKAIPKSTWIIVSIFFFFMLFIEGDILKRMDINANDKYVSTIFLVITLLATCIAYPTSIEGFFAKVGRKYSLDIYVFHNFILFMYYSLRGKFPSIINDYIFKYASPILIFFITLIFAIFFRISLAKLSAYKCRKYGMH